jgi:iron complex outermembrane recepter protein
MTIFSRRNRKALLCAASVLAILGGGRAFAQESTEVEEVVVTGFRESLADALQRKRTSDLIVESITAEDIGKFPDRNVAEALARLPGVQVDRVAQGNTIGGGQGQRVLIRGLSQNVVTLNQEAFVTGLELSTFGEGNDRNTNSLEGIPAELLGGVDVFKSPNASLIEGGMGGLINLRTRSPFDFGGTTVAGNIRAGYQQADGDWTPLGALTFSHQFGERFAILASVTYDDTRSRSDILGGANRGNWRFSDRGDRATVSQDYFAPEYRYATDRTDERKRFGATVAVGLKLTDSLDLSAEWFHSDLKILVSEASLKFPFAIESPGLDASRPYEIDENGVLLNGTFRANSAEAISYVKKTDVQSDNFQLRGEWNNGGRVRASAGAVYSRGEMTGTNANNDVRYTQYNVPTADPASPTGYSHQPANPAAPANYLFGYKNGELPSFDLLTADLITNPAYGYFKSHWVFGDESTVENWAVRADAEYDADWFGTRLKFTAGARYADRSIDYTFGRYLADYHSKGELDGIDFGQNWTAFGYFQDGAVGFKSCELPAGTPGIPGSPMPCNNRFGNSPPLITPFQTFVNSASRVEAIKDFWANGHITGNSILVQNRSQMEDGVAWIQALYPSTPFSFFKDPEQSFAVREKTTSGYLMADIGAPGEFYHINLGARVVHTELAVDQNLASIPNPTYWGTDSWNGVLRDYETVTNVRDYTDILPSVNVVVNLNEAQKIRFSAARVVSRAPLFELGRGFHADFTRNPTTDLFEAVSGSAGNPNLDPFRAWQQDLSWEWYFGRQGFVSAAVFWKEIDSFVTVDTRPEFVNDQAGGRFVPIQRSINGDGGNIKGFELAAQYAFDNGFGFTANYTFSDSDSPFSNDVDRNLPIPGVSRHAYNVQAYYEGHGFEARLSYTWRDKSFQQNFGFSDRTFGPADPPGGTSITRTYGVWNRAYGQLDGQLGYQITPNFGVVFEVSNITAENLSQYLQYENLPFTYAAGSRTYLLGGRFRFGGQ